VARAIRLYEQEPGEVAASARLGEYVRRDGQSSTACVGSPDYITNQGHEPHGRKGQTP